MSGYDFLDSASVSLRGKKNTTDSTCEAVVERDIFSPSKDSDGLTGYFAVHGGYAGPTASQYLAQTLRKCVIERPEYETALYEALEKGMLDCQRGLYKQWNRSGLMHGANSTVMVVRDGFCFIVNAGAGAAVLCGVEGSVRVLTSPSVRFDELESFTCCKYLPDCEDEFVILGCDGFWEKLQPEQAVHLARSALKKYKNVKFACEKLAYAAQVSGSRRNINVQIVMLSSTHIVPLDNRGNVPLQDSLTAPPPRTPSRTLSDNQSLYLGFTSPGRKVGRTLYRERSFATPRLSRDNSQQTEDLESEGSAGSSVSSITDTFTLKALLAPKPRQPPQVAMPVKSSGGLVVERKGSSKPSPHSR
ncbi:putative protein phosphatase 2C 57 [Porphyridium purpureum]|uniref:PPM-type phosphatase domain-containing protein n=1 Tax=Porphyridium purpureum TaxID=35688 RepID=A0A5J4YQP6_PORPP|nr:putative protein phosphatase 2C 57 [Porphyridium purpureum]|eukprot:POR4861..scf296_7